MHSVIPLKYMGNKVYTEYFVYEHYRLLIKVFTPNGQSKYNLIDSINHLRLKL